jgi:hypothetical protein
MYMPAWLLLLWSGAGATCAAAIAGSLLGARSGAPLLMPGTGSGARAVGVSLAAGLVAYPLAYGLLFEATGRADVLAGLALGSAHGVIVLVARGRKGQMRSALRSATVHVIYGATLAFLYVTP